MKVRVTICLEQDLLSELDQSRGLVPRSALIEDLLKKQLNEPAPELCQD